MNNFRKIILNLKDLLLPSLIHMSVDLPVRSKKFGVAIAQYYISFKEKRYYEVASQLFRSGTSIGANIAEAQNAISKKEFIVKMQIALKEAEESLYRFDILEHWFWENIGDLRDECRELVKILVTILKKTKNNMKNEE